MTIREMSEHECLEVLSRGRIARLACARDNQPYIVPIYYAYHMSAEGEAYLYGFTTLGQKILWMRANPRVCVEWDDIADYNQWMSVVVFGHFEELQDSAEGGNEARLPMRATPVVTEAEAGQERTRAYELLRTYTDWWQPGFAAFAAHKHRDETQPFKALYYRIRIDSVTGHRASPDAPDPTAALVPTSDRANGGWLRRFLRGMTENTSKPRHVP